MVNKAIIKAREKYRKEGELIGLSKGKLKAKAEVALNCLNAGVEINIIPQCTDFSEAEILQLRDADKQR